MMIFHGHVSHNDWLSFIHPLQYYFILAVGRLISAQQIPFIPTDRTNAIRQESAFLRTTQIARGFVLNQRWRIGRKYISHHTDSHMKDYPFVRPAGMPHLKSSTFQDHAKDSILNQFCSVKNIAGSKSTPHIFDTGRLFLSGPLSSL
jgi:hypothetical protein